MPFFPIARPSALMHNCNNEDAVWFNAAENTKRETVYETTTDIFFNNRPRVRVTGNAMNSGEYFNGEIITKAGLTFLVVFDSSGEFLFGLRMKGESHFSKRR
jgi:hypothetical protein